MARRIRLVGHGEQLRHPVSEPPIGDPLRGKAEDIEGRREGHHTGLDELQARGRLALRGPAREDEGRNLRLGQLALVGGPLRGEQPGVDAQLRGPEVGEISQPPLDSEVVGVSEGGLGAQGAPLLEGPA